MYELLVQNSELKKFILFLYLKNLKIPLKIEHYEKFNKDIKEISEYIYIIYKMIDNETRNKDNDFVIIDATHLNPNSRKIPLKSIYKECKIIVIYFTTSIDECIRRNELRTGREKVPKQAVQRMFRSFMVQWKNARVLV